MKSITERPQLGWAVTDHRGRIAIWTQGGFDQLEIFFTRKDARQAAMEWSKSGYKYRVVHCRIRGID